MDDKATSQRDPGDENDASKKPAPQRPTNEAADRRKAALEGATCRLVLSKGAVSIDGVINPVTGDGAMDLVDRFALLLETEPKPVGVKTDRVTTEQPAGEAQNEPVDQSASQAADEVAQEVAKEVVQHAFPEGDKASDRCTNCGKRRWETKPGEACGGK